MGLISKSPTSVIVTVAPGIQRDALVSLLRAQPALTITAIAADAAAAQRAAAAGGSDAIVVDAGLAGDAALDLAGWLRRHQPACRCIVLVDSTAQCREFLEAGAQAVLLKGCLDEHLLAVLSNR